MPRLLLASSVPSVPTPEPLATSGLNSTASITASSMTLTHWSRPSASSPLHDTAEREQNSHSSHYNGLTIAMRFVLDDCCARAASGNAVAPQRYERASPHGALLRLRAAPLPIPYSSESCVGITAQFRRRLFRNGSTAAPMIACHHFRSAPSSGHSQLSPTLRRWVGSSDLRNERL